MNTSKSFEPERSFNGAITRFNIWDNEQEADVIETQSIACGEEEGNIIAWPEVKLWTFDGVEIIEGDHCFPGTDAWITFRCMLVSIWFVTVVVKAFSTM